MQLSSIIQGEQQVIETPKTGQKVVETKEIAVNINEGSENQFETNSISNVIETAVRAIGNKKARITLHIDIMPQ